MPQRNQICQRHGDTPFYFTKGNQRWRCAKCRVEAVRRNRLKVKEKAVAHKGGSCEKCGYNKCVSALEFHHLDESTKEFGIAEGGNTRSWAKIEKELAKCIILCANCHRELHHELDNNTSTN